jgi:NAD(P)H-quinone oxidoreductase subunit 4L
MQIQLEYYLLLAAALFCIGIYGLVTSRNAVRVLMLDRIDAQFC